EKVTKLSGPNGNIDWINCGITGGGWTPPRVEIKQLVTVTLASARHTAFAPCRDNIMATFEKYGKIHGIPSILLASIAMQESSCIPSAVGGAGEQGLMQLTHEKCKGAPGGNCQDIDFNIRIGAEFFATLLAANKGDIFTTIGKYNGWYHGMTYSDATSAANTCCRCQNNLDYVHQFVNGWLQGIDAYDAGLGKYFNLDRCQ
ncbi:glycoside hydrolase family 23 protein, partial [Lactarius pseudohatsudake]